MSRALQDPSLDENSVLSNFAPQQYIGVYDDTSEKPVITHGYLAQVWPGKGRGELNEIVPFEALDSSALDSRLHYIDPIDRHLATRALQTVQRNAE